MHSTKISEFATELRRTAYADETAVELAAGSFAHVVIDMQHGFMPPDGIIPVAGNPAIVPNINKISAAVRKAGGKNIFVRFTYDPNWTVYYGKLVPGRNDAMKTSFSDGSKQHALFAGLDVACDDLVINKTRFSCFTPGTSPLEHILRSAEVSTIIVTGCTSSCCVESTIRDGMQLNFSSIFISDANTTLSDTYHNGAVDNLFGIFGCDVCTTADILGHLSVVA